MNKKDRIKTLKLAQQAATATTSAKPVSSTTQSTIDLSTIPGFRRDLFNVKPDIVNDIHKIVNIINKYLISLTENKVSFNIFWNNPSITGSQFTDDVKNLMTLGKWVYNVIKSRTDAYDLAGLQQFAQNFMRTVQNYLLSPVIKGELITVGVHMLSILGTQQAIK